MDAKAKGTRNPFVVAADADSSLTTIKASVRILQLIEYFSRIDEEVRVMQVSRALDIPQSSVSSLLARLVDHGYVAHDAWRHVYWPAPRLALIGMELSRKLPGGDRIQNVMERLCERTDGTVFLSSHNQTTIQTIHVVRPSGKPPSAQSLGHKYPVVNCTPGRLFLSSLPDGRVHGYVRRYNSEVKPCDRVDVRPFVAELAQVRASGYAISRPDEPIPQPVNSSRETARPCCLPQQNRLSISLPGLSTQRALMMTVGCPPDASVADADDFAGMVNEEVRTELMRDRPRWYGGADVTAAFALAN